MNSQLIKIVARLNKKYIYNSIYVGLNLVVKLKETTNKSVSETASTLKKIVDLYFMTAFCALNTQLGRYVRIRLYYYYF